jgi:hypothetical protein
MIEMLFQDDSDYLFCNKVCQSLTAGLWFSPGNLVSATNKSNRHNIAEIL